MHRIDEPLWGYIPLRRYASFLERLQLSFAALPNLAETRLAAAIRQIGTAEFEPAIWAFFQAIAAPDNIIILAYRDSGAPEVLYLRSHSAPVFAQIDEIYLAGAYRLDPFFDLHLRRAPSGAYRVRDIAPDAFQRSRYFIDYYEQTTLIDEITFVAYAAPHVSLNLCLGRDTSSGRPFSARDLETCQRVAGVVAAMAERQWVGIANQPLPAENTSALLAKAVKERRGIHLSQRQAEVALLVLQGHSTTSIGLRLGISPQTVKVFRKQLYRRCAISSQAELFALLLPLLKSA